MPIIEPAKVIYSISVWKRFGLPNGLGQVIPGWSKLGDDCEIMAVYQRRQKRGNYWTKTNKIKNGRIHCSMNYSIPHNPKTLAQIEVRTKFAEAVSNWQALTNNEKSVYNKVAIGSHMAGYNLYIKNWLNS